MNEKTVIQSHVNMITFAYGKYLPKTKNLRVFVTVFHPSEVDKMSTRNFWELSGKKETASSKWL